MPIVATSRDFSEPRFAKKSDFFIKVEFLALSLLACGSRHFTNASCYVDGG
jgi:hypothetical protein